jgi:hypothetical protein
MLVVTAEASGSGIRGSPQSGHPLGGGSDDRLPRPAGEEPDSDGSALQSSEPVSSFRNHTSQVIYRYDALECARTMKAGGEGRP